MRLDRLAKKLSNSPESNLRGIVAWGQFEWGVSRSIMLDYLKVLEDIDMISVDEDPHSDDGIIFWEGKK